MKEYGKKAGHGILAVIAAFMLLAGCSGSGIQESAAGRTSVEESSVEIIDFNEDFTLQEQEPKTQEAETQEPTQQEPTAENTETAEDSMVNRKQPPEGFELKFSSDDWGLSFGEPGTQSIGNASAEDLAWYDAYYVGDDSEKVIYLTFDCGYENGNTEPILDALKKHNVTATFFVVGHFLETAPDLTKRMVEEGHAVGNHTYHHPDMSAISDQESFEKELNDVADLFYEITGTQLSKYYRPPQGKCNAENVKMAQKAGCNTIFWSLAYVDWDTENQPSHAQAFDKLTTRIHPGAIVLLHNTSQTNGEILDELLTKWENMGYTFKPLSELTLH
jgi:Predicted xylanase/chitin deacetylase